MKFRIAHEMPGRIRFSCKKEGFTTKEADIITYYLQQRSGITKVKIYERTGSIAIFYQDISREKVLNLLIRLDLDEQKNHELPVSFSSRETNVYYKNKLLSLLFWRGVTKFCVPRSARIAWTLWKSRTYILEGLKSLGKRKIEIAVLDGAAITAALATRDFDTAGSIMFMLKLGDILEEWTHKKSVDDLARSLSLNIDHVWLKQDDIEVMVPLASVETGDLIVVRMGAVIPIDGTVADGDSMVNEASLTGESLPVQKQKDDSVFAGTVLEEGELVIRVKNFAGQNRIDKIMNLIENSEQLKSTAEFKAEHLADSLVPYSFLGSIATYLFTRNVMKAVSVLMVDFSCALKLSMPIAVLSSMRESSNYGILVKGGNFLEAVAEADTVVFDKTGTLTEAKPKVADVIPFKEYDRDEMLRLAACLEEHFPHSIASAVVRKAEEEELDHKEMHTKVEYIVAHGIVSSVEDKRVMIGSAHFIFEDENVPITEEETRKLDGIPQKYSHLYLAIAGELAAVICIDDPLRKEAKSVLEGLRLLGVEKLVMLTGDSERTAKVIAEEVGVDEYLSGVLPEDKAGYIEAQRQKGRKVIMIGDGINDSPALSAANVGIAMNEGADIAKEIADITVSGENLTSLLMVRRISSKLMRRIHRNYRFVITFNTGLIFLGVGGLLTPGTSALLHNASTIGVSLNGMRNLVKRD